MSDAWTPRPQDKPWLSKADWLKRHEGFLAQKRQNPDARVVLLGDSITDGWAGGGKAAWDRVLAPLGTLNFGIGGDEVQHVLWRVNSGELDGIAPKVVVVLIGTNNIGNVGHKAPEVARGVELLLEAVRQKLPAAKVLLHAVFPRAEKPDAAFRLEIAELNRRIAPLADGRTVFWLDMTGRFVAPDGRIDKQTMPDFLHLSAASYERWADVLGPELERLLA